MTWIISLSVDKISCEYYQIRLRFLHLLYQPVLIGSERLSMKIGKLDDPIAIE